VEYDAIIVGAGPAGLTAAIYLARFRRRCLVLEDGRSRARWIPTSHNIPGFVTGVGGGEFLAKLTAQAGSFGAQMQRASVSAITDDAGVFALETREQTLRSRFVLLATGVRDHLPDIPGAEQAVQRSVLRVCPICDAYEAIDKRIAVICNGPLGEREGEFLRHYSDRITLLDIAASRTSQQAVHSGNIECIPVDLSELKLDGDRVVLASPSERREFDVLYLALGCTPRHDLARSLGAACDESGALRVNAHQETSIARLYAAGDVVRGLNQVVVAAAESAIAATDIHNKLRGR
jgi:thioredoxin reductase (NADPH)